MIEIKRITTYEIRIRDKHILLTEDEIRELHKKLTELITTIPAERLIKTGLKRGDINYILRTRDKIRDKVIEIFKQNKEITGTYGDLLHKLGLVKSGFHYKALKLFEGEIFKVVPVKGQRKKFISLIYNTKVSIISPKESSMIKSLTKNYIAEQRQRMSDLR